MEGSGIDIEKEKGGWYKSVGQGMGAALNTAGRLEWLCRPTAQPGWQFKKTAISQIVVEGDKRMFNQYGVMLVNPEKHPERKEGTGREFIDWLISPEDQKVISNYKIDGEQLFYPNAADPNA